MAVNRQRQFPELVIIRTPEEARDDLVVYSRSEVDAAIGSIDLSDIENDISNLQGEVINLSGAIDNIDFTPLETDIENLDISLTKILSEEFLRVDTPVVTGSDIIIEGYIQVNVNGETYKLALVQ